MSLMEYCDYSLNFVIENVLCLFSMDNNLQEQLHHSFATVVLTVGSTNSIISNVLQERLWFL